MEGPPWFEDLEIGSLVLVTISNSYFTLHTLLLMFLACFDFNVHYVKCNGIRHVIYIVII